MLTRPIPSTGEALPVLGLGTYRGFDFGFDPDRRRDAIEVTRRLFDAGGSVLDSSPMYGRAEAVVGEVLYKLAGRDRAFLATKVWTSGRAAGIAQMRRSFELMRAEVIDLMQVHNLVDVDTHLDTLEAWKAEGRIRYLGVTHYNPGAHAQLEAVIRQRTIDFVQLDYSLDDRAAEARLLPLCQEKGVAVLVNLPFGGGGLVRSLARTPLPSFAESIGAETWPQLLLKFVLGHPAVTCAIPGTADPGHMTENLRAAEGDLAAARARILTWVDET